MVETKIGSPGEGRVEEGTLFNPYRKVGSSEIALLGATTPALGTFRGAKQGSVIGRCWAQRNSPKERRIGKVLTRGLKKKKLHKAYRRERKGLEGDPSSKRRTKKLKGSSPRPGRF